MDHIGEVLERLRRKGHWIGRSVVVAADAPIYHRLYFEVNGRFLTEEEVRALEGGPGESLRS